MSDTYAPAGPAVAGRAPAGDPAAAVWAMAHLGTPMAIRVAATLRLADHLSAGPRDADDLAGAVAADPDALGRLLHYLARRGVLERDGAGRYALTPLGEVLRDDHPAGMRAGLDIEGVGRADLAFVQLLHSVRTGEAAFPLQFGRSFWDDLATDPARTATFDEWMGSDVPERAADIVAAYDWGSLGHLVDVGGGDGSLMTALASAHPQLRGTVLDRPDTVRAARRTVADAGLDGRVDVVGGSFFDPLPPGAGGYLLSLVLHDWGAEQARAILRRCAEAAAGSPVLVVERTGADGRSLRSGMDLRMLALYGGRERGVAEIAALAADTGLDLVAVHPAGAFSVVELAAPGPRPARPGSPGPTERSS